MITYFQRILDTLVLLVVDRSFWLLSHLRTIGLVPARILIRVARVKLLLLWAFSQKHGLPPEKEASLLDATRRFQRAFGPL